MFTIRQTETFIAWVAGLRDRQAQTAIVARLGRLSLGAFGDVKPVGDGVSELRVHVGAGYRLYFVKRGAVVIVLLCGGDKSSQRRDVARARAMAADLEE